MPHARARLGSPEPRAALRALAIAIDDMLLSLGRGPRLALAGGPALSPGLMARVGDAAAVTPARPKPAPKSAAEPAPKSAPTPAPKSAAKPAPASAAEPPPGMEDEHSATWELVSRAQAGDGEAFGLLYDRYVDTVFRFIYFRVNDRALAEDFTSETFLRALRRIGTISYQGRDIGAWFVTIARNIVLDHMKSARNRLEIVTGETIEGDEREPGPEATVIDGLTAERLMAAVGELGDEQRECVMLRFIQGFSVSETASVMGKNDGAIKALQHRAVRKLAELVGGELR